MRGVAAERVTGLCVREYNRAEWRAGSSKDDWERAFYHDKRARNTYVLVPNKINVAEVKHRCYVDRPGLLPLPEGVGKVENLSIYGMKRNSAGAAGRWARAGIFSTPLTVREKRWTRHRKRRRTWR